MVPVAEEQVDDLSQLPIESVAPPSLDKAMPAATMYHSEVAAAVVAQVVRESRLLMIMAARVGLDLLRVSVAHRSLIRLVARVAPMPQSATALPALSTGATAVLVLRPMRQIRIAPVVLAAPASSSPATKVPPQERVELLALARRLATRFTLSPPRERVH